MNLIELKNGYHISSVIWACNMFTYGGISESIKLNIDAILNDLLDIIISRQINCSEEELSLLFTETVRKLEKLLNQYPLEDSWIYEYARLNSFFAEIMEALNFPVKKGKYNLISNFVYGKNFDEE